MPQFTSPIIAARAMRRARSPRQYVVSSTLGDPWVPGGVGSETGLSYDDTKYLHDRALKFTEAITRLTGGPPNTLVATENGRNAVAGMAAYALTNQPTTRQAAAYYLVRTSIVEWVEARWGTPVAPTPPSPNPHYSRLGSFAQPLRPFQFRAPSPQMAAMTQGVVARQMRRFPRGPGGISCPPGYVFSEERNS